MQFGIIALLILGGIGLTVQSAVNARLKAAVGAPVLSAMISFGVGLAALGLLAAFGVLANWRNAAAIVSAIWNVGLNPLDFLHFTIF